MPVSPDDLRARASDACELCGATDDLQACGVPPGSDADPDRAVLVCGTCAGWIGGGDVASSHAFCLQQSAWSEVAAVQVSAYRLLHRLPGETWAADLIEQLWMPDDVMEWAQAGLSAEGEGEATVKTVDSNGAELKDGDSVTLIKDLDVKGTSFVAKRGTLVKNISLSDDPELVEGRVNKVGIFLKTCFLKKAT
jgi:protein PhnA